MVEPETSSISVGSFDDEIAKGHLDSVKFQADAALIRELGERLVGAPQIALAELVKNAYDADATECSISLWKNRIVVSDNGHGMSESDFRSFWMRIGTTNKRNSGKSRRLQRNLTGSKGVGRLSAQFLAHRLQIITVADLPSAEVFHALVDWDAAVTAGDLTSATAQFRIETQPNVDFPRGSTHGTTVILEGLKHDWTEKEVGDLGRELWMLSSPLPRFGMLSTGVDDSKDFVVSFHTALPGLDASFMQTMRAAIDSYYAVVDGSLDEENGTGRVHVKVRFRDGDTYSHSFKASTLVRSAKWQVRIYDLVGRQASGVPVRLGREYFEQFGVMMFDAGFRLPYYGIGSDWLGIDYDHAHRLSRSLLLPEAFQVERGLNDLPSQGRMLGVVSIDTGAEARAAALRSGDKPEEKPADYLQILVTRDRLVANNAFKALRDAVRLSLDFYATRQRLKMARVEMVTRPTEPPSTRLRRLASLAEEARAQYPTDPTVAAIVTEVAELDEAIELQSRADDTARALLGPLASAGMAALALEHENRKDIVRARRRIDKLKALAAVRDDPELISVANELDSWIERLESARRVFAPLIDGEERERVEARLAGRTLNEILRNIKPLILGTAVSLDVDPILVFPPATLPEWHALFQNVILNAVNAMLDNDEPSIGISGGRTARKAWVHVNDRGVGVDLSSQDELFEPFSRSYDVSPDRQELGLGGMGLGLTIVRMIARQRGCAVAFVKPDDGWNTTFEISWSVT